MSREQQLLDYLTQDNTQEVINRLNTQNDININYRDEKGNVLTWVATYRKNYDVLKVLLSKNPILTTNGEGLLTYSIIMEQNLELTKIFLEAGLKLDTSLLINTWESNNESELLFLKLCAYLKSHDLYETFINQFSKGEQAQINNLLFINCINNEINLKEIFTNNEIDFIMSELDIRENRIIQNTLNKLDNSPLTNVFFKNFDILTLNVLIEILNSRNLSESNIKDLFINSINIICNDFNKNSDLINAIKFFQTDDYSTQIEKAENFIPNLIEFKKYGINLKIRKQINENDSSNKEIESLDFTENFSETLDFEVIIPNTSSSERVAIESQRDQVEAPVQTFAVKGIFESLFDDPTESEQNSQTLDLSNEIDLLGNKVLEQ